MRMAFGHLMKLFMRNRAMAEILKFRDSPEKKMRRALNNLIRDGRVVGVLSVSELLIELQKLCELEKKI